jgi:hypothetical protein
VPGDRHLLHPDQLAWLDPGGADQAVRRMGVAHPHCRPSGHTSVQTSCGSRTSPGVAFCRRRQSRHPR